MEFAIALPINCETERMTQDNTAYDKRVLLTGGAGFIGSWVMETLVTKYPNYLIVCFDNLTYCSSLKNIQHLTQRSNFKFIKGDITDLSQLENAILENKINSILHFAAESDVDKSFENPLLYVSTNIIGVVNILEMVKKYRKTITKFVHMSTDEVYGENAINIVDETSSLQPTNPYSATKASADLLIYSYIKSFHLPIVIIRSNNVFGPRQYPEKIIPYFCLSLTRSEKMKLQGNGSNRRRYLYVSDCSDAIVLLFHQGKINEIYNIGLGVEKSNMEICKLLLQTYTNISRDSNEPITETQLKESIDFLPDRPFNDVDYNISCQKLTNLGWKPTKDFNEAIEETMSWYKQNGNSWWIEVSNKISHHYNDEL